MFLTKRLGQNDRIDRGIISRFRRKSWFSWRNVTKKRIRVGFQLFQLLYDWFISSCMRNTDKFILDIFVLVRPGTLWLSLAPFGRHLVSLWLSFGRPLAFLRLPGLPGAPWEPCQMLFTIWSPLSEQIWRFARTCAQDLASRNLPASPGSPATPAETVSRTAPQAPYPHAPGARMTWVKQTPSNDMLFLSDNIFV